MKTKNLSFIKIIYYYLRGDTCLKCGKPYTNYGSIAHWCSSPECTLLHEDKPRPVTDYVFSGGLIKGDGHAG